MAMGIFEQLAWLTTRVKRLCCAVDANTEAIAANKEANPCYLEITTIAGGGFPGSTLEYYNEFTGWDTPFTSLVIVGDSIQRLYGGSNVNLGSLFSGIPEITSINDGCGVVTSIGNNAFDTASNLSFVNLPKLTLVPESAFAACTSLTNISLPSVISIESTAFDGCTALVSASFASATSIGDAVFQDCSSLTSVSLPKLQIIGSNVFLNSGVTSISLPSLTTMNFGAFSQANNLISASLPKVLNISSEAFLGCDNLVSVLAPKATTVGGSAFESCSSLITIDFPLVTTIGGAAFDSCTALTTVNLPSVTNLGGTPGNDNVFVGITGNTITLTVPVAMQTINSGNPDGDITNLLTNNPGSTVNYI